MSTVAERVVHEEHELGFIRKYVFSMDHKVVGQCFLARECRGKEELRVVGDMIIVAMLPARCAYKAGFTEILRHHSTFK